MTRYWRWWWKRLGVVGTLGCLLSVVSTLLIGLWLCDFTISKGQFVFLMQEHAALTQRLRRLECWSGAAGCEGVALRPLPLPEPSVRPFPPPDRRRAESLLPGGTTRP